MSTTTQFDIDRLKALRPIGEIRIVRPPKRKDMMYKFRSEANRVLDNGGGRDGVRGRQPQSNRFDEDGWVDAFVANRIRSLPKKTNEEKMVREVNRLTKHIDRDQNWHGVILMETSRNIYHSYTQTTIDMAWARFWKMPEEDLAHVA